MKLLLELLGPPRLMGARQRFELRAGSLSVGRSPEADWTISDTDRLISRLHLRIDASHGAFVLTDTSANGVYVNGSAEPVGYGASVGLRDGDRLRIGEAQIAVSVEPEDAGLGTERVRATGSPFDLDAEAFATQLATPAGRDPFGGPFGAGPQTATAPAPVPAPRAVIGADWMNGPAPGTPPEASSAPGRDRGGPVILPLRPGGPVPAEPDPGDRAAPQRATPDPAGASLLDLVEARPGLSARDLAAALDAVGQGLDPRTWQEIHQKIKSIVNQ